MQETQQTNQPIENFNENIANQFIIVQDTSNQQQNLDNDNLENEIHIHMPEEESVNQEVNNNESDLNVLATRGEELLVTGNAIEAGNITENVHNQVLVDNEGTVLTTFDMVADSDGGLRLVESSKPLNFTNVDKPNIENAVVIVSLPMAIPSSSMTAMQSVTSNITIEPTVNMTTSIASHLSEISSALPTEIMSTSTTSISDTAQLPTVSYSQQIQMADNTFAVASKPSNNVFDESLDESRVDSVSDHDNESILPSSPLSTNQQEDIIDYDSDIKTVKIPLDSSSQQGKYRYINGFMYIGNPNYIIK